MPAPIYKLVTATASSVALSAATAKTVLGAKAHANSGLMLKKWKVSFDGVTASAVPVEIEVCYCTWATNGPGTNSTSLVAPAITQESGRVLTAGFTAAHTWTTEPTALTTLDHFVLTPNGGVVFYDYPLAEGFAIRCKAPATVNVVATMAVSRI
jgi:hypothetical protein